jgi:hypothetical protein
VKFATIHLQHSVVVSFDILYRTKWSTILITLIWYLEMS